jgi:Flp pilus assembly protein TadG
MKNDRGEAMLELALVVPALMLLVLGILQFGLVYHGRHVAGVAAQEAARLAAAEGSDVERGRARALQVLWAGLGKMAERPEVQVDADADYVKVRVDATMRGILPIPGLSEFFLSANSSAYVERFRSAGDDR